MIKIHLKTLLSERHMTQAELAKRLLDIHYSVHSATMVILDEDAEIVKES